MSWEINKAEFRFLEELKQEDSAWIGHIDFAYDLVVNTKPRIITELGTHRGHSLFSFAQAVSDKKLKTKLYGIDSWEGDVQAGFYGDKILQQIKNVKNTYYKGLNINLIQKYFRDAVSDFEDNSIDILHIDGLHTYEAVKQDYNDWLPKVKKDGIILLHDIAEKKGDFGVYKLWDEIKEKDSGYLEFTHSHGLGVIFLGNSSKLVTNELLLLRERYYPARSLDITIKGLDSVITNRECHIEELRGEITRLSGIASKASKELETVHNSRFYKIYRIIRGSK